MVNAHGMLARLSALCGILPEYHDLWGKHHPCSDETRRALLRAMHLAVDTVDELRASLEHLEARIFRRILPPVMVVDEDQEHVPIPIWLPETMTGKRCLWRLILEDGGIHEGEFLPSELPHLRDHTVAGHRQVCHAFQLPFLLSLGYHTLEVQTTGQEPECPAISIHSPEQRCRLIVTPKHCFQPPVLAEEGRVWGPVVQLYAVRSRHNWGMGDFTDLRSLVDFAADQGGDLVGVNPLHALFPHDPERATPYGPSSRRDFSVLYVDVEALPDFAECEEAQRAVSSSDFQALLRDLRGTELVNYRGVAALKLPVLEKLYHHFQEHHLRKGTPRALAFEAYRQKRGKELRGLALFQALQEHFHRKDLKVGGWPDWPEAYRNPSSAEVATFASDHEERIGLWEYVQWQAELQLGAVRAKSDERGLGLGLYGDLAVGVNHGGAEAWLHQDLYAMGASVGAPPDDFNLEGQDWGLPPLIPHRLVDAAFEPFIATLRANMRHAGALRIDHVMGLMRLFWVPHGSKPIDGAYVAYPLQDMLGILALESQRNRCLIVGEDLGTVPDEVRVSLKHYGVLSCRPLYFERNWNEGSFKSPAEYPREALVSVSTHDLPTLNGFWQGYDLDQRIALNLFPSEELRNRQVSERARHRTELLLALEREGLLAAEPETHPVVSSEMMLAVHRFLARSPSKVLAVQPEDVLGQVEQMNLPGCTESQYPSWRRKLSLDLEEWSRDPRFVALLEAMRETRFRGQAQPLQSFDTASCPER